MKNLICIALLSLAPLFTFSQIHVNSPDGDVSIGDVVNPDSKLHVNGTITYNGSLVNASDQRLKKDISVLEDGLDVILQLNPVRYRYNGVAGIKNTDSHVGLFAQDLQKAAPYLVKEFTYREEDEKGAVKNSANYLSVEENAIKYLLVNAVKEQQKMIDTQRQALEDLQEELAQVKNMVCNCDNALPENTNIGTQTIHLDGQGAYLEQNQPNPFTANTLIKYYVPADAGKASIKVHDTNGQLLHTETITQKGKGQVKLKTGKLAPGTYSYTLLVDGEVADTKQMIIGR